MKPSSLKKIKARSKVIDSKCKEESAAGDETYNLPSSVGGASSSESLPDITEEAISDDKKSIPIHVGDFQQVEEADSNKSTIVPSMMLLKISQTMSDESDNEASMDKENQAPIKNVRGKPSACVFVASLCSTLTDDELCISVTKHFEKWGDLSTVKVLRDTSNRPYAFVQYTNDNDCKRAIKLGQDSLSSGRRLRCEAAKVNRTLFISSSSKLSENGLKEYLSIFGEFDDIKPSDSDGLVQITSNPEETFKNWFVKFTYRDDAIRAYANLTEKSDLEVEWAQNLDEGHYGVLHHFNPKNESGSQSKSYGFDRFSIFIGQLNSNITKEELTDRFEIHGNIKDLSIIRKENNTFAFITYDDESAAASAVERENHSMLKDKTMHVQYREVHHSKIKPNSTPQLGFAHAPPPINLMKRINSNNKPKSLLFENPTKSHYLYQPPQHRQNHQRQNQSHSKHPYQRQLHHTSFKTKSNINDVVSTNGQSKFSGYGSPKSYKIFHENSPKKPLRASDGLFDYKRNGNIKEKGKDQASYSKKDFFGLEHDNRKSYNIFNDIGNSVSKVENRLSKHESPTPPETMQSESRHFLKSGSSPSTNTFSDRSEPLGMSQADPTIQASEASSEKTTKYNNTDIPYYYYVPPNYYGYGVGNGGYTDKNSGPYGPYSYNRNTKSYQYPLYYPTHNDEYL
ncbi:hypothetical protein HYPBUDRAFT_153587 [Hyphopichia burtonii NRRL Y-1933]|uniref:RRM domain-containing protein n=1 Tax=Hyphopichia burtonii NRRL Y-1933 TaxID=984485 RepID=A0A1E4RFM6_9ASCO|nr:hypothetical protein HYPBUDRAFT_153587 [Hyphopichia burtonii NRRL Y-1933]ODV66058.1 hypothetical protein HYPBUDRAFT_153587 [Hyphopichia burtonii NRRL Y-1933]